MNKVGGKNAKNERKTLKNELERRENAALNRTLSDAQVICCTLSSVSDKGPLGQFLKKSHFDCVIIDECAQVPKTKKLGHFLV